MRRTRLKTRTPLAPMSERRRAELLDAGRLQQGSTFAAPRQMSEAMRTKRWVDTGPDRHTVEAVLERAAHSCELCGAGLHGTRGVDWSIHHRKRRSQGLDNTPPNLAVLCGGREAGGCHHEVHAHVLESLREGWLVARTDDPASKPVPHALYGHIFLLTDGSLSSRRPTLSED